MGYPYPVFLIAANFFTLWFIGAEVITYATGPSIPKEGWPLGFLLILSALTTLQHLVWRRPFEIFDLVLLVINAIFYAAISTVVWGDFRVWMGSLYFLLAFVYFALAYGVIKRGTESSRPGFFALCIGVVYFTTAVPIQLGNHAWVTIAWAAEFTVLMWLAGAIRVPQLRYFSYGVFVITGVRLLFFDTAVTIASFHPIVNERFFAFAAGIAAAYTSTYLLWRDRETQA